MKKDLPFWKLVAVLAALTYLYKVTKANGGTMDGKYNPQKVADLAAQLVPPEYRKQARQMGTVMITRLMSGGLQ